MAALQSARGPVRLRAAKALRLMSAETPELLYPDFEFFAGLLDHENLILRWNALLTIAHLARVDMESKIEGILDQYLSVIRGPNMISAANAIHGAAIIGTARPGLIPRIIAGILRVERARYATPECRNVAIGHALDAFAALAPLVENPRPLHLFAARQLQNPRASTSARARKLLKSRAVAV